MSAENCLFTLRLARSPVVSRRSRVGVMQLLPPINSRIPSIPFAWTLMLNMQWKRPFLPSLFFVHFIFYEILAAFLRRIHQLVYDPDHFVDRFRRLIKRHDPDAERNRP